MSAFDPKRAMPKADPRSARKRQRSIGRPAARPTSKEYQQALGEIDTLRLELIRKDQTIAQLQAELRTKDQTIDHVELNDRAKTKRMDDLHDQINRLGSANRDLEAKIRNLMLDKERLLGKLAEKQQFITDHIQPKVRRIGDILGEVLETVRIKEKAPPEV
jgi:chromosome segregation ATPase